LTKIILPRTPPANRLGAFFIAVIGIGGEFLSQLAQFLCQIFPAWLRLKPSQIAKHIDFTADFHHLHGWHFSS
jgi:hypothetical protein